MAPLPKFPSIDLSGLDATKLSELDDKVLAALRDAAYITIGFGVLTVQQVQVRRRELMTQLEQRTETRRQHADDLFRRIERQLDALDGRLDDLEAKLDGTVDRLGEKLPEQAATVVGQAHGIAKTARKQVRGLIRSAA